VNHPDSDYAHSTERRAFRWLTVVALLAGLAVVGLGRCGGAPVDTPTAPSDASTQPIRR
jgi:hypothetical protein